MVWEYENLIIPPPPGFRDGYFGGQMPVPKPRTIKPVPAPRKKTKNTSTSSENKSSRITY